MSSPAQRTHGSAFSTLATMTGTLYFLRLPNTPNFLVQCSVATCLVLQYLVKVSHPQMCRCEEYSGGV